MSDTYEPDEKRKKDTEQKYRREREKYAKLSPEQKDKKIKQVIEATKKRRAAKKAEAALAK